MSALPERGASQAILAGPRAGSRRGIISSLRRFVRHRPLGALGAAIVLALIVVAALPGVFAPHAPNDQAPVLALRGMSNANLFGTDNFGRDVLSRVLYGARTSLYIGFGAVALGLSVATLIGALSAYAGGWVDTTVQRLVDGLMALPWLVVLMSILALVGPGRTNTLLAIGLLTAPGTSRVLRGSVLRLKGRPFVEAARATGCSTPRIVGRYILPGLVAELVVLGSIGIGAAILTEASLSFLGFGVVPPDPSWGYMLGIEGRRFFTTAPWLAIFPGAAISLTVFGFNMFGDALRDMLDPRARTVTGSMLISEPGEAQHG